MGYLPSVLMAQQLCFSIFVLDQFDAETVFNKGKLYNSGWLEVNALGDWDCFIFHDVDLFPQNISVKYECAKNVGEVKHLGIAIDKFNYKFRFTRNQESDK